MRDVFGLVKVAVGDERRVFQPDGSKQVEVLLQPILA